MPTRVREEIDHTHFLRDWNKLPVAFVRRGDYPRLPFEAQGVFVQLLAFSEAESQIPGWFLEKESGAPMREGEIVYQVAGAIDRIDVVKASMAELKRVKLLAYTASDGWSIPQFEDFSVEKERKKARDANKLRQQRKRDRDRQSRPSQPVPLREAAR